MPEGPGEPAARMAAEAIRVSKRFGANQALRNVSISIRAGESRALVGRNGAGKSTLVALLTGLIAPDSGEVRLAGAPAPGLADRRAWRERVACVFQRSTLVPTLTVAENLFLNAQPTLGGFWVRWPALRQRAEAVLEEWGLEIDVTEEAERLTVEQRQIVEIARALLQGNRFMILDEPTAELEGRAVGRLFDRVRRLQDGGVTFLYISHHLEEIYEVCRTVTVLRDGRVVASAALAEMSQQDVVAAMVGETLRERAEAVASGPRRAEPGLSVSGLSVGCAEDISFEVGAGECVGLTGLAGSGKEAIADAITGLVKPRAGRIALAGTPIVPGSVAAAQRAGVGYVPRDRRAQGIVPLLSVAENLTMTIPERLGAFGVILPAERARKAGAMIQQLQLVAASPDQPIGELSGGNQQKAVLGRAMAADPKILVLVHPTQGIDIASKEALFSIVTRARREGTGVLIVSDDLDELTNCDRVLVVFKGRIAATFAAGWQDHLLVSAIEGMTVHD
ncbi:MAG TPA: sugar ABC transporter ATP-binding protein [Acetobacteraceae bacterium]|nr:sugar ABC transporter ATP-binding protein [Acetobacteraceae bacterium]